METKNTLMLAIEEKLVEDEQFLKDMMTAQSPEDTQAVLERNGFNVSMEEVNAFIEQGKKALDAAEEGDELSEDDLEAVAGGGRRKGVRRQILTYLGVAAVGVGMVALCAVLPEAAPAWIAAGKAGMVAVGAAGTAWTLKGYAN